MSAARHTMAPNIIGIIAPIRLVSEANAREHWGKKAKRVKDQRRTIGLMLSSETIAEAPAYLVTIVRVAPRLMDTDNLVGSCKAARDSIAKWLGFDDGPTSPVEWSYGQRKGEPKQYAVDITIEAVR